jgi:hypothetical protein
MPPLRDKTESWLSPVLISALGSNDSKIDLGASGVRALLAGLKLRVSVCCIDT